MEITWHGNTCVTLKDKERTIVINPDREAGKLKGDIVLNSLNQKPEKVEDAVRVFDWPGEYEMKGVPILGLSAKTKEEEGEDTEIFYFEMGKFKVCHLGALGHKLKSEQVKQIGDVDILFIDASEGSNLSLKQAADIIDEIDPRILIPVGNGSFANLIKELGAEAVQPEAKLSMKSTDSLPEDSRQIVVLKKS